MIVTGTVIGLSCEGRPVLLSIALIRIFVENTCPPFMPVASICTLMVVPAPLTSPLPELAESERKEGALAARLACQLSAEPPPLLMVNGCDAGPLVTLKVSEPGFTFKFEGAVTLSATPND